MYTVPLKFLYSISPYQRGMLELNVFCNRLISRLHNVSRVSKVKAIVGRRLLLYCLSALWPREAVYDSMSFCAIKCLVRWLLKILNVILKPDCINDVPESVQTAGASHRCKENGLWLSKLRLLLAQERKPIAREGSKRRRRMPVQLWAKP